MAGRLKDKVAIVVGAGSSGPGWGNGKCTAVTFAREGAKVMCVDLKRAAAEETVGLIAKEGGEAIAVEANSAKNADVAMVDACMSKWGRIDVLDLSHRLDRRADRPQRRRVGPSVRRQR